MADSEEEVEVLVQRVVKDLTTALKRNPNIDEVGVIVCPDARCNRSPIVLLQNKLGVESWCVKFLLQNVHNKLLMFQQRRLWLEREALVDITCTLLLLNPDFTTAWNVRKELVQSGVLHPEKDLYLGQLALTRFPKSPETWIHRRWLMQQLLLRVQNRKQQGEGGRSLVTSDLLTRTLHQEMKVCSDAADRYPSNYNAWSHRIWVLQNLGHGDLKLLLDELSTVRSWVSVHVSDHSGFHYRQFLLKELIAQLSRSPGPAQSPGPSQSPGPAQSPGPSTVGSNGEISGEDGGQLGSSSSSSSSSSVLQLVQQEMDLVSDLIQSFPGHETLWSHRRHVFYLWHQWRTEHHHSSISSISSISSSSSSSSRTPPPHSRAPGPPRVSGGQCCPGPESTVNGPKHGSEAMEVDALSLPDSKRLKRGGAPPPGAAPPPGGGGAPPLTAEHSFVAAVLDGCPDPEQRRWARAYQKWLDTVVGQRP